ncbi:MAG: PDZ domain-containing protein [Verrucomicrobia bacterium]|nr:PDZ domain-containing protein [Verrucomicrobiota bacterium]
MKSILLRTGETCIGTAAFMLMFCLVAGVKCLGQDVAGIGVALNKEGDGIVVKQVLSGGPAALSGKIKANDRIIAIAQGDQPAVKTAGLDMSKVVQMIRGPKGSVIRLTMLSPDRENSTPQIVELVRGEIKAITAAASAKEKFVLGQAAPEIEGEDVDGKEFTLSDYRGKVILVDFWGDW